MVERDSQDGPGYADVCDLEKTRKETLHPRGFRPEVFIMPLGPNRQPTEAQNVLSLKI